MNTLKTFASDNYAGVHPEIFDAMLAANEGHTRAYGQDTITAEFDRLAKTLFGEQAEAYPVFNGTGANIVALSAITPRWGAVIGTAVAHINTDEAGAPEKVAGLKIINVPAPQAKLTPALVEPYLANQDFVHAARPSVLSLTQATEWGTLYTVEEIRQLASFAHAYGLLVHLDGARLANAVAATGHSLADYTTSAGVDILSLGATKNGAMNAEAVVVLNPEALSKLSGGLDAWGTAPSPVEYIRKYSMQLASKMRFISAQLLAMYGTDLYLRNAGHANTMARRLAAAVDGLDGIEVVAPVEVNSVFARIPGAVAESVRAEFPFYDWDDSGVVRWMCSFDTTEEDLDRFVAALSTACLTHKAEA